VRHIKECGAFYTCILTPYSIYWCLGNTDTLQIHSVGVCSHFAHTYCCLCIYTYILTLHLSDMISRLLKSVGLFCKRALQKTLQKSDITSDWYGVASICRLLKIIGLFCKRALQKRRYSAKETCHSKEPTNRSHPISVHRCVQTTGVCRVHQNSHSLHTPVEILHQNINTLYQNTGILM